MQEKTEGQQQENNGVGIHGGKKGMMDRGQDGRKEEWREGGEEGMLYPSYLKE